MWYHNPSKKDKSCAERPLFCVALLDDTGDNASCAGGVRGAELSGGGDILNGDKAGAGDVEDGGDESLKLDCGCGDGSPGDSKSGENVDILISDIGFRPMPCGALLLTAPKKSPFV